MDTFAAFLIAAAVLGFFVMPLYGEDEERSSASRGSRRKGQDCIPKVLARSTRTSTLNTASAAPPVRIGLPRRRRSRHGGRQSRDRKRLQMHRPQPVRRCLPGRRHHHGDGRSQHARRHAHLTPQYETSVQNLFIAGELGGLALIKNAIAQGRECVDTIADRITNLRGESAP